MRHASWSLQNEPRFQSMGTTPSEAPQPSAHQKHQIGKLTPWMANDFTEVSNATFLSLGWHLRFDAWHSRDADSESWQGAGFRPRHRKCLSTQLRTLRPHSRSTSLTATRGKGGTCVSKSCMLAMPTLNLGRVQAFDRNPANASQHTCRRSDPTLARHR